MEKKYRVLVNGIPIRIHPGSMRIWDDPYATHLNWAYVLAVREGGTVVDEDGKVAPAVRHPARVPLYDYQPEKDPWAKQTIKTKVNSSIIDRICQSQLKKEIN